MVPKEASSATKVAKIASMPCPTMTLMAKNSINALRHDDEMPMIQRHLEARRICQIAGHVEHERTNDHKVYEQTKYETSETR